MSLFSKSLILIAVSLLSPIGNAAEMILPEGNYTKCVQWTTFQGVHTSKKFELRYSALDSIHYAVKFYRGSASCEGSPETILEISEFTIVEDLSSPGFLMVYLKSNESNSNLIFLEIMGSDKRLSLIWSKNYPVEFGLSNSILLDRED